MTVAEAIEVQADYGLRGPDFETMLVGPVTATIIDADRLVRQEWRNGFPNWAMYRCVLAGDQFHTRSVRQWIVAFSAAYLTERVEKKELREFSDELACLAAWDAFYRLRHLKWLASGADVAEVAGVDPKTYRKVRAAVYRRLRASLDEYWIRMQIAFRQAVLLERHADDTTPSRYSSGRGFDVDEGFSGTGNFRAVPRGSGC
jgi:hypothetical protein